MKPAPIDVIGSIRGFLKWGVEQIFILLIAGVLLLSAPLLYTVGAEYLVWQNPNDLSWAAPYFLLGPLVCSFWMIFICHFHSIRLWRRQGKFTGTYESEWADANGGWLHLNLKATGFMVLGFLGSALAEAALVIWKNPQSESGNLGGATFYFAVAPLFVFAPVIIVILKRWNYDEQQKYPQQNWSADRIAASPELYNDPDLERRTAILMAEAAAARAERRARGTVMMCDLQHIELDKRL